ncbi:helix-turn-helix domain-containing protein [Nocardia thailandica]|uniref:helix-turn-helix domain-containing protein n=1 Tax=Nocardia thailandica TaxID=257275 RepID=UPI0005B9E076|nr:helix-turn-helix transcriptional regulator [Nocardia thailandica]
MKKGSDADWLRRLGEIVVAHRESLGISNRHEFAHLTGLSYRLLGDLERGRRALHPATYAVLENALDWTPGSVDRIADGKDPVRLVRVEAHGDEVTVMLQSVPDEVLMAELGRRLAVRRQIGLHGRDVEFTG